MLAVGLCFLIVGFLCLASLPVKMVDCSSGECTVTLRFAKPDGERGKLMDGAIGTSSSHCQVSGKICGSGLHVAQRCCAHLMHCVRRVTFPRWQLQDSFPIIANQSSKMAACDTASLPLLLLYMCAHGCNSLQVAV